jgi:hypothetical protein
MQTRSMLMSKGYFCWGRGSANDYAQYKSANVIKTSNSLLPSQRRMDNLDTASPLAQPVSWGFIFSLVILSTIGVLIYACIFNCKQHSFRVKLPSKIICSRCRYFNDNHFLRCAIHPVDVMTEQAVDCMDYCPKTKGKWIVN